MRGATPLEMPSEPPSLDSPLVLVVDDYEDTRELLAFALRRKGLRVVCAVDGFSALDIAERCAPQAIVMDIAMPGLDGIGVLRRLRADPATAAVPVLVYTASDEPQVARDAASMGALDCVPKVGRFTDLRERIECCLALATRRTGAAN